MSDGRRGLLVPACLVGLAVLSGALAFSFYFRGEQGDFHLLNVTEPSARMNEYWPPDASEFLVFPRLAFFGGVWALTSGLLWGGLAWRVVRRDRTTVVAGLTATAPVFYPLIALLLVPAHHFLGWPMTLGPVFLLILCIGLCAAVAGHVARPALDGRAASALFSVWGVVALSAAYVAVFSTLAVLEYKALHMGFVDSGWAAEAVHHASQGEALRTNYWPSGVAFHLHPVLILEPLSYLYLLWPAHEMLLVLNAAVIGSGGVAVYLLALAVLDNRFAAWCMAVAYLASPLTAYVNLPNTYGFRPMSLLGPAVLWSLVFLERRRFVWFFFTLFLALLCKETVAPTAVMIGVFVAWRHRWWRVAAGSAALGFGYYLLVTQAVVPYVFDAPYRLPGHFERFGDSAPALLRSVVTRPAEFLSYTFGDYTKILFALHLVVPLLLLPLLSPSAALVWAASYMILIMASHYSKYVIFCGPQSPAMGGLYLAAVYGLRNLAERRVGVLRRLLPPGWRADKTRALHAVGGALVAATVAANFLFFVRCTPWRNYVVTPRARRVAEFRDRIPRDASLFASYRLAAHFTDQKDLYMTSRHVTRGRYALVDLFDEWVGLPTLAQYRSMLLRHPCHVPVYADDGFILFQRDGESGLIDSYRLPADPAPAHRLESTVGGTAKLLGYDAEAVGPDVRLTLYWRCTAETEDDLAVVVRVDRGDDAVSIRYLPADGLLPTWAWQTGDIIRDPILVPNAALSPDGRGPVTEVTLTPVPEPQIPVEADPLPRRDARTPRGLPDDRGDERVAGDGVAALDAAPGGVNGVSAAQLGSEPFGPSASGWHAMARAVGHEEHE